MNLRYNSASLKQLMIFNSVVKNNGFSAAQAELNISAASISIQMKELEYQLGIVLCNRGRTGFKLTDRGKSVYEASKGLFASFDNFNCEVANIREELAGEIRIGLQDNISTNSLCKLHKTFERFNQRKNSVKFSIEEAESSEQESRTLEGYYNFSIGVFHHRIPGLTYQKLFDESVALYCAKGHSLFDKPDNEIRLENLKKEKIASTGLLQSILRRNDFLTQAPEAIAENMDAISILLLSGHYIGFLPNHIANIWIKRGLMRLLLPEKTVTNVEFHMIQRQGGRPQYAVETFIKDLLSCHNIEHTPL
ncbi:MAG: LysR family transcriptional regulator [Colwellia sp.]|nr:LysR family transcriptional regulator [Colwellia sp.]